MDVYMHTTMEKAWTKASKAIGDAVTGEKRGEEVGGPLGAEYGGAVTGKSLGAALWKIMGAALFEIPSDESGGALGNNVESTTIGAKELIDESRSGLVGVGEVNNSLGRTVGAAIGAELGVVSIDVLGDKLEDNSHSEAIREAEVGVPLATGTGELDIGVTVGSSAGATILMLNIDFINTVASIIVSN